MNLGKKITLLTIESVPPVGTILVKKNSLLSYKIAEIQGEVILLTKVHTENLAIPFQELREMFYEVKHSSSL